MTPRPSEVAEAIRSRDPALAQNLTTVAFMESIVSEKSSVRRLDSVKSKVKRALKATHIPNLMLGLANWWRLHRAIQAVAPHADLVLIPYLDIPYLVRGLHGALIDTVFRMPWAGLLIAPVEFRRPDVLAIGNQHSSRLSAFRSKHCRALALLDEKATEGMRAFMGTRPIHVLPDVTDETLPSAQPPEVIEMLARAQGRKVILLIGALSKRKGILTVIEMAEIAQQNREPYFFAVAGPLDEMTASAEERAMLSKRLQQPLPANFFSCFKRIPDGAIYNAWVAASDLMYAVYEDSYHSSNTLTKAALFHKPILVVEDYCTAERVREYGTGEAVPVASPEAALAAVRKMLSWRTDTPRYDEYAVLHSERRLSEKLAQFVES